MSQTALANYYNRYDESKNYDAVLIRDGYGAQGAEINEIQSGLANKIKKIADVIFKDGDVIRDALVVVDQASGDVVAQSGQVYLSGAVRGVPSKNFTIPTMGTVSIGVYLQRTIVTELEDPSLYNPAIGTASEGEAGAGRLQINPSWGYASDGQEGDFFAIYSVDDGVLRPKAAPPSLDSVTQAIATYDRDSAGGSYIVEGLMVLRDVDTTTQVYTVSEGRARVAGYPVDLTVSQRITKPINPNLREVDAEPHLSTDDESMRIDVDYYPMCEVTAVRITKQVTETVTHGAYSGASDPLANTSVVSIVSVSQGNITYTAGTDYSLNASQVDWSASGSEPAPNSSYAITYQYITLVDVTDIDLAGFTVAGAVENTQVLVTYTQMLPRIDKLCLSRDGLFVWVEGVAASWNPQSPRVPDGMLSIATVYQMWDSTSRVVNDGVATVPMDKIAAFDARMDLILAQTAQNRLMMDASTREAGAKKGLWVDPCLDNSMRDQGIEQTAVIVNNAITLPTDVSDVFSMSDDITTPLTMEYTLVPVLSQLLRTSSMQVNPYSAFDPLPAFMRLTPAIDRWVEENTEWASPLTTIVNSGHYVPTFPGLSLVWQNSSSSTQVLSTSTAALQYLRPIDVAFKGTGFAANELVDVTFDGISVTTTPNQADADGVFAGEFTIPEGISAGTKQVMFNGRGGTTGSAVFSGQGTITTTTLRNVTTTVRYWHDPLAQTFVLDAPCMIAALDLWFTACGTTDVVVQIRETTVGIPNGTVLCEAVLKPNDITLSNNATRVQFTNPVMLQQEVEYAIVVMCSDAITSLSIAELGKNDPYFGQWVVSQPYQVGVLLSSSNASTWTPHQDKDMAFRLLKASFVDEPVRQTLGSVTVTGVTDMLIMSVSEESGAQARVEFVLEMPDDTEIRVSDGQPVCLATAVTGTVTVSAILSGSTDASPVLYAGTQLIVGETASTATYISRGVAAGQDSTVKVIFDAYVPSGATITAKMGEEDDWTSMTYQSSTSLGDGWQEITYSQDTDDTLVRVKLDFAGTATARPMATNVRILTI